MGIYGLTYSLYHPEGECIKAVKKQVHTIQSSLSLLKKCLEIGITSNDPHPPNKIQYPLNNYGQTMAVCDFFHTRSFFSAVLMPRKLSQKRSFRNSTCLLAFPIDIGAFSESPLLPTL